jgi:hypothetical protein
MYDYIRYRILYLRYRNDTHRILMNIAQGYLRIDWGW